MRPEKSDNEDKRHDLRPETYRLGSLERSTVKNLERRQTQIPVKERSEDLEEAEIQVYVVYIKDVKTRSQRWRIEGTWNGWYVYIQYDPRGFGTLRGL